jgi:hypothetical protein
MTTWQRQRSKSVGARSKPDDGNPFTRVDESLHPRVRPAGADPPRAPPAVLRFPEMRASSVRGPRFLALAATLAVAGAARGDIADEVETPSPSLRTRVETGVRECYRRALLARPGLGGRMTVHARIELAGAVTPLGVEADSIGDVNLKNCVLGVFASVHMGAQTATAEVRTPLTFAPGS